MIVLILVILLAVLERYKLKQVGISRHNKGYEEKPLPHDYIFIAYLYSWLVYFIILAIWGEGK